MKKQSWYVTALFSAIILATFILVGCSSDNSLAPETPSAGLQVKSNTGMVTLLKMKNPAPLSKGEASAAIIQKFITVAQGGEIAVGNELFGVSRIIFQPNDLPENLLISIQWSLGSYCEGVFGPHGTQFNQPVRVELSYKNADLTGINEDDLRVYYFNEDTNLWEAIGGTVDKTNKVIIAYLEHFSRYAIVKT
ncbi:hypothetical protein EH223_14075 [candidate division KSB1 bacterium]|nr:hypothetical protein [candidate division KSB1 bacterium]RQW01818.1 MAG: hypothetical protein EH223_14075 [candidate division KSB1 bacterium]